MEVLSNPRKDLICSILESERCNVAELSILSYYDLIFLKVIQYTELNQYADRIKTQLNIIRENYIRSRFGETETYQNHENLYDSTRPFKIAVVCANRKDFKVEILDIVTKIFDCKNVMSNRVSVHGLFEFHQINRVESLHAHRFDGLIETENAVNNPKYDHIKLILPMCFII